MDVEYKRYTYIFMVSPHHSRDYHKQLLRILTFVINTENDNLTSGT